MLNRGVYKGVLDPLTAPMVFSSGLSSKVMSFNKFGFNPDVDTTAEEDVWDEGGNYQYLSSASVIDISSTSAEDGVGGTGISVVEIFGLDGNWDLVSKKITLNGLTPVQTTSQFIRVYRLLGISSDAGGDTADAAGKITATASATTQAVIQAGNTSTKMSMFSIPRGYTGFISQVTVSGGPNDDFVIDFQTRVNGGLFSTSSDIEISNSAVLAVNYDPQSGPIVEMSDLKAKAQAVSQNASVRIGYTINLIKNDYLQTLADAI